MGKNQAHKMSQKGRGGGGGGDDGPTGPTDGLTDATFHSPAWHAARIAAMQTTTRMSWEEFKTKQDEEKKKALQEAKTEDEQMKEFRAQLDADRDHRLARGSNHAELRHKKRKREKKEKKDKKEKKSKKGDDKKDKKDKKEKDKKDKKEKEKSKKKRKKSKKDSSSSDSDSDSGSDSDSDSENEGQVHSPVRLSSFFSH
eukprot:CAMPEP_0198208972 /NCGR_PEP_ID=MMETSP1445-20131203/12310_1 /TAXON_ID=36898 /ORGANISM="Pyramimonas sp., Strain CCMP2087" /LENGTH=198 /DNA_ID=CAMNT_0043882581 /DNA_START=183 /DNA_END=779 /DNA_ORIENTATION=-